MTARHRTPSMRQVPLEALLRLLEHDRAFLCVLDRSGIVVKLGESAGGLLRRDAQAMLGHHCAEFAPPEDMAAAREFLDHVAATPGQYGPVIGRMMCGDGSLLWTETMLDSTDMAGTGLVMLNRDITTRMAGDEKLRAHLLESQRFEMLGRLAAGVVHELNNQLTVIAGQSELLTAQLPNGSGEQAQAQDVRLASARAADLVRQLHRLGRGRMGDVRETELGEQVERMREMVLRALGPHSHLVHERGRPVMLAFDVSTLEQALALLAMWARGERPQGCDMLLRCSQCMLTPERSQRLGLAVGPHAMLEVELAGVTFDSGQPPLAIAEVAGVLSQVGASVECILRSEFMLVVCMYWPLTAPDPRAGDTRHPLVLRLTRTAAPWQPLISAP